MAQRSLCPFVPHGNGRLFRHSGERASCDRTAKETLPLHSSASFAHFPPRNYIDRLQCFYGLVLYPCIKVPNALGIINCFYGLSQVPRHISLTASNAPLPARASRNRSLIQRSGKRASGHRTAKEALAFRSAQAIPNFIPPAAAFFRPTFQPFQSRKQAPFHPNIRYTPFQGFICLAQPPYNNFAGKIFKSSKKPKKKTKVSRPSRIAQLGKNARTVHVPH